MIISRTGYSTGWGSAPWKFVSGLTHEERAAVDAGELVFIVGCPPSGANTGTTYGIVVRAGNGRYGHRVPTAEQIAAIEAAIAV